MANSGGSLLAVRWAEKFCGAIPVASLTRCRNSPSSIASTQLRTEVGGCGGSERRGAGGCTGLVPVHHCTQQIDGSHLADEFAGRGRDGGVTPKFGVKIESGQGLHRIDVEAAADAHQSGLGNLAAYQLLGQCCSLDAGDPADVSSAGIGRNAMKPALERLGR